MQGNPNPREPENEETQSSSNSIIDVDMDLEYADSTEPLSIRNSRSVPCFLKKVFDAEIETLTSGSDHRFLIIAVHAVLLESGFTAFDPATNTAVDGDRLPEQWASRPVIRIRYTIPSLLNSDSNSSVETVVLKFMILGKFVMIYGCLDSNGLDLYRTSLDTTQFVPCIDYVCRAYEEEDGNLETTHEKDFFEFWKIVKDRLSTPLLIALCNKTGLRPPSCFMILPTDLKIWILESVSGVDVARVGCVCSELKYLSSNDDLWRKKFEEEFGSWDGEGGVCWREKYVSHWKRKKMEQSRFMMPYYHMRRGHPRFGAPMGAGIVVGDYGRMLIPFGARRVRRFFPPHYNFDGFRATYSS